MLITSRLTIPTQRYAPVLAIVAVTIGVLGLRATDVRPDVALLLLLAAIVGLGKTSTA